jgi:hypothetical protein
MGRSIRNTTGPDQAVTRRTSPSSSPRYPTGPRAVRLARIPSCRALALTAVDRPDKKWKTLSQAIAIMARVRDEHHIDADLFDLFLASDIPRRYAEQFLRPEQIDDVDVGQFTRRGRVVGVP